VRLPAITFNKVDLPAPFGPSRAVTRPGRTPRSTSSSKRRGPMVTRTRRASRTGDRKSTRLNSSHVKISYAVFCLKKKKEGRRAVKQLGSVLADNPDINVLIEGHTDNEPYYGNGTLKGTRDLSTKRATAIVEHIRE